MPLKCKSFGGKSRKKRYLPLDHVANRRKIPRGETYLVICGQLEGRRRTSKQKLINCRHQSVMTLRRKISGTLGQIKDCTLTSAYHHWQRTHILEPQNCFCGPRSDS